MIYIYCMHIVYINTALFREFPRFVGALIDKMYEIFKEIKGAYDQILGDFGT